MSHILIIEDEPGIYTFLKQGLEEEGYSISIAVDGEQGIELFQSEKPDLILLDWVLPKMDGIDVCKAIRQEDVNIPILFLTARIRCKILSRDYNAEQMIISKSLLVSKNCWNA
jgi:two component transcriptional regulator, winged helix family